MDDCLRPLRYERYLNNTSKFSIYPTENNACQLQRKTSRVSSAITCVSLTQIGYKKKLRGLSPRAKNQLINV